MIHGTVNIVNGKYRVNIKKRYAMSKNHQSVHCFSLNIRGLVIFLNSPNFPTNGLWYVATVRLSYPRVNYLVCSNTQARPSASPSIGNYLSSGPSKNLDPSSVTCQPSSQQSSYVDSQLQCF